MSSAAEIIYTLIVWDYIPLAHYTAFSGTFKPFVQKMADKVHRQHQQKLSYQYQSYMIHCLVNETEPRFAFLCMTGDQYPQLLAFTYLNELRSQFLMYLSTDWKELDRKATVRFEMNTFARQIQQISQQYTSSHYDLHVLVGSEVGEIVPTIPLDDIPLGHKKPSLIVRHMHDPSLLLHTPSRKTTSFFFSNFLTKHPFLTIGLFIMLAVVVFLYFVVIVPLCGSQLEKTNEHGRRICWFD